MAVPVPSGLGRFSAVHDGLESRPPEASWIQPPNNRQSHPTITEDLLDAAILSGTAAAQYIKANRFRHVAVASKGMASEASDMVTEIDIRAQEIVLDGLEPTFSRYGLGLLAEEGSKTQAV